MIDIEKYKYYQGENLIFIVGSPRSGTTWLQKLIGSHPDVGTGTESDLFSYYISALNRYWNIQKQPTGRGYMGLPTYMSEDEFQTIVKVFARSVMNKMINNSKYFVEKTPQHAFYIKDIKKCFPEAKIVHMIRDPRDVCFSIIRVSKDWSAIGATTIRKAIAVWKKHIDSINDSRKYFSSNHFLEIQYSTLFSNTPEELSRIMRFIGLEFDDSLVKEIVNRNTIERAKKNDDFRFKLRGVIKGKSTEPAGFINTGGIGSWEKGFNWYQRIWLQYLLKKVSEGRFSERARLLEITHKVLGSIRSNGFLATGLKVLVKVFNYHWQLFRFRKNIKTVRNRLETMQSKYIFDQINSKTLNYINSMSFQRGNDSFDYFYTLSKPSTTLYSSVYAVLTHHLYNDLEQLTDGRNRKWIEFINSFQSEDGLYRDQRIQNDIAEVEDWWGWRHLSAHVVTALKALGSKTKHPFKFVEFLYGKGNTRKWLEKLNWTDDAANTSNAVMNYGVCLQYNRDFWNINIANDSLLEMFDYLNEIQDEKTGLWGGPFKNSQNELSQMEQTAYHLWVLYFYDGRRINYIEKALDSCLALQNEFGGFGPGYTVSKISNPFTSACEDIDCIDPLSRFYFMTDYRKKDIGDALRKAIPWILYNQNNDGGFVFRREEKFVYGHELMTSQKNESNMFATWFRILSLAYISKVLPNEDVFKNIKFNLNVGCPGYQFWKSYDGN